MTQSIKTQGTTPLTAAQHRAKYSQFYKLMGAYVALSEAEQETEAGTQLLLDSMMCAPPEMLTTLHQKAEEMGLIPPVRRCDEQGNPVWTDVEVAQHMGVSLEEVRARADKLKQQYPGTQAVRIADVNSLQSVH